MPSTFLTRAGQCLAASAIVTGIAFANGPVANADVNSLIACINSGTKMIASCCIDEGGAYSYDPATNTHTCTLQPQLAGGSPTTVTMPVPTVPKVDPPPLQNSNNPKPGATVPAVSPASRR